MSLDDEFTRQRDLLLAKGYPALAGLSPMQLLAHIEPLRAVVRAVAGQLGEEVSPSRVPFVIVIGPALISAEDRMRCTHLPGRAEPGRVDPNHGPAGLGAYAPIEDVELPEAPAYLILDVSRGEELRGLVPTEAQQAIFDQGRSPLTLHEGIALLTAFPDTLAYDAAYLLAGSRRGDRRIPALWIAAQAPKLGWCWQTNPHSWMGMASTDQRAFAGA